PPWSRGLLARMPEVNQAWDLPFQHGELGLQRRYQLGKQLRLQGYKQVIILPNSLKSALVPFWAKIPLRTAWQGELPRRFLLNDARRLDKTQLPLMIQRFAALAFPPTAPLPQVLPWPKLQISAASLMSALTKHQLQQPERLLILAPGAEF